MSFFLSKNGKKEHLCEHCMNQKVYKDFFYLFQKKVRENCIYQKKLWGFNNVEKMHLPLSEIQQTRK